MGAVDLNRGSGCEWEVLEQCAYVIVMVPRNDSDRIAGFVMDAGAVNREIEGALRGNGHDFAFADARASGLAARSPFITFRAPLFFE